MHSEQGPGRLAGSGRAVSLPATQAWLGWDWKKPATLSPNHGPLCHV